MTALRLGSLFDGIGVFPLAAVRCGIEPVWASEIEKAPISITKRHFPDMAHLGDVTKLDGRDLPPVHIVLEVIAQAFEYDRIYTEREVNIIIADFHDDFCTIRRDMVGEQLLDRDTMGYLRVKP